jgi:hypothetical protein
LAREASNALRLIAHLIQAVLAKAFQGELVQGPSDEPASLLFERVSKERQNISPSNGDKGSARWPRREVMPLQRPEAAWKWYTEVVSSSQAGMKNPQ